jgi:lactoylglutathione lyase
VAERLEFDDFTLAYLRNEENDFELELTRNNDTTEPYTHGSGYGHLAVVVDDLEKEHARFTSLGLNPRDLVDFGHAGRPLARFFFVEDPDGYKIEVMQRFGRYV